MSIASRISSIEEHIKESYQELEGIGIDTTGLNKNLENIPKLIDGYWETLPKVTGEGTSITLDNTKEGKMKINLKGNTSQESTTGKNIFALPDTQTLNSKVYTNNSNGTFNISGTASANTNIYKVVDLSDTNITNGETYTLSRKSGGYNVKIDFYQDSSYKSTPIYVYGNALKSTQTITIPNGANKVRFILYFASGNSTSLTNEWVQLEKGSSDTSFEPYTGNQPSPSPDYPQDIQVVSGDNTIKVAGKNLFDISTITENKTIDLDTGEVNVNTNDRNTSDFIFVTNSVTYSCNVTMTRIAFYDENKTFISSSSVVTSIVTPNNCNYVRFSYDNSLSNIQFERGLSTEFTPYAKSYPISLGNIELCKIGDYQDSIVKDNGKWYLNKQIGKATNSSFEQIMAVSSSIGSNLYAYACSNSLGINSYSNVGAVISNLFVPKHLGSTSATTDSTNVRFNMGIAKHSSTSQLVISIEKSYLTTGSTSEFDTFLTNNNFYFYYIKATPTYEEITDTTLLSQLEALAYSYDGTTNISQVNDDLASELDVVALEDI